MHVSVYTHRNYLLVGVSFFFFVILFFGALCVSQMNWHTSTLAAYSNEMVRVILTCEFFNLMYFSAFCICVYSFFLVLSFVRSL